MLNLYQVSILYYQLKNFLDNKDVILYCLSMMYTFFITWWQPISQHHHDIALLVDQAFLRLDVHPKDGLLELEELASVFDLRDTDGN